MVSISKMVQSSRRSLQYILLYLLWQLGTVSFGWAQYSSMGLQQKTEVYSLGKWRWAEDYVTPTDDKQVHAIGSFGLYYLLTKKGLSPNKTVLFVFSLGLVKECVDALVPWELYGRIGGDGFSKYDIFYNSLGLFSAYIIDERWEVRYMNRYVSIIYRP